MAKSIEKYIPDLDKIARHNQDLEPKVLSPEEYDDILSRFGLYRGTRLSDVGILKAMEAGLIKIWSNSGYFDLLKQIQSSCVDLTLGNEFWHYKQHCISRLTLGKHQEAIKEYKLIDYNYKLHGDEFVFHPGSLVLSLTDEIVSVSNVVVGSFDGRSLAARLGLSNHQTAGLFHAGFCGRAMMEISNSNYIDIAVPIGERIGSMIFTLLDQPSTRPECLKTDSQSNAFKQTGPFGFRFEEWDVEKQEVIAQGLSHSCKDYAVTGDPAHTS